MARLSPRAGSVCTPATSGLVPGPQLQAASCPEQLVPLGVEEGAKAKGNLYRLMKPGQGLIGKPGDSSQIVDDSSYNEVKFRRKRENCLAQQEVHDSILFSPRRIKTTHSDRLNKRVQRSMACS